MDILKLILSSLISAGVLFVLAKLMGHKQLAQLDFFDYVTGITIGSIAAEMATELEKPWQPLLAMVVYGVVSVGLNLITKKFPRSRKFINGSPTIIMDRGKIYRKNMKKAKLDLSEFMMLLRQEGYFNPGDVQTAIFECNGHLTILPKAENRPVTPSDLNLQPEQDYICSEVIMDGRILGENLKRMDLGEKWLCKKLKEQGFKSEKDIYLGVCDKDRNLALFTGE